MPKIYLKARPPIEVSYETAKQLNDDWLTHKLAETIQLGSETIKSSEIKGISGVLKPEENVRSYNLDIPEQRAIVREFEKEVDLFKTEHPKVEDLFLAMLEAKGAIIIKKDLIANNYSVRDPVVFEEFSKKWNGFHELRWRRERAEASEKEAVEQLISKKE